MYVNVLNGPLYLKYVLADGADYFGRELISKRLVEKIDVVIEFTYPKESLGGIVMPEEDCLYPKLFYIAIDGKMGTFSKLRTLAHEMVHVKQYAQNELRHDPKERFISWKGKKFDPLIESKKSYWQVPWELEAFSREEGLTLNFCTDRFYTDRSWYKKRYSV